MKSRHGRSRFVDATTIATRLLGDAIFANFFLLGVAYQHGLDTHRRGRHRRGHRAQRRRRRQKPPGLSVGPTLGARRRRSCARQASDSTRTRIRRLKVLDDLIARNANLLVDYQDKAYADRYLRLVERVRQREAELQTTPGDTGYP